MTRWLPHSVLILFASVATAERVESIPQPERYVIDTTGSIQPEMLAVIERVGIQIGRLSKGDEMVVAIISTTGGKNHRQFARELFHRWGAIDTGEYNESFGILLALDDNAIEIVVDSSIEVSQTGLDRIIADRMRGHFEQGKPGLAVLDGARSYFYDFFKSEVFVNDLLQQAGIDEALDDLPKPSQGDRGSELSPVLLCLAGISGCIAIYLVVRRVRRYRSRDCPHCRMPMELLSEEDEDVHLSTSEVLEEKLKSANYDVWMCTSCSRTQTVRYGAFFSRYSKCPACGARTSSVSTSVISEPTNAMAGMKEITESCDNCDYKKQYRRSIPSTGS
jgi:uncharacterized protein